MIIGNKHYILIFVFQNIYIYQFLMFLLSFNAITGSITSIRNGGKPNVFTNCDTARNCNKFKFANVRDKMMIYHSDVILESWRLQSSTTPPLVQQLAQANQRMNIKTAHHSHLVKWVNRSSVDSSHKGPVIWESSLYYCVIKAMVNAKIPSAAEISIRAMCWNWETVGTVKQSRYISMCRGWIPWNRQACEQSRYSWIYGGCMVVMQFQ